MQEVVGSSPTSSTIIVNFYKGFRLSVNLNILKTLFSYCLGVKKSLDLKIPENLDFLLINSALLDPKLKFVLQKLKRILLGLL